MKSPRFLDARIILGYIGKVVLGLGALAFVPSFVAMLFSEWEPAFDFLETAGVSLLVGSILAALAPRGEKGGWKHGMVASALSWIVAMALAALPYWRSGHYASFIDCMFDAMSGFTTTGLTLVADLDHVSKGLNAWRHLITFVGGQGIVVLALALVVRDPATGYKLYVGEGKDERLFPSVLHTAKAIWKISLAYLALGTVALWAVGMAEGMPADEALLHGAWMYMSSWSTGGFAPMSQNVLYYHSFAYEMVSLAFFIAGSFNFALHFSVLKGDRREMRRNVESISFAVTLSTLALAACSALAASGVYTDLASLFRKGFYHVVSGHTTTGFMTVYARQLALEWGPGAIMAMTVAMMIGASACSTAGGIKGLRIGILASAVAQDVKRLFKPSSARFPQRVHHIRDRSLDDAQVRAAAIVAALYLVAFTITALAGGIAGYGVAESAFEAASVTGNVGLTIGVSAPGMPNGLKIVYILGMWGGRMEYISLLIVIGYAVSIAKARR